MEMQDSGDADVMEIKVAGVLWLTMSHSAFFLDSSSFMFIFPLLTMSLPPLVILDLFTMSYPLPASLVQVTEGKQDLERACQLSRKMKKEADILSEWLSATEAELVHKSTTEGVTGDLDTEISWAKVSFSWDGLLL